MTATAADLVLRRDRMLALIRERDYVRVGELSERFGISEVTVRSDLDALAASGDVQRIRGGAIPREHAFEVSETSFAAEKLAIGRAAAEDARQVRAPDRPDDLGGRAILGEARQVEQCVGGRMTGSHHQRGLPGVAGAVAPERVWDAIGDAVPVLGFALGG